MRLKTIKTTFKIIILLVAYYLLLFWVYGNVISIKWSYRGLVNELTDDNLAISIVGLVFTIVTYLAYNKRGLPSSDVMNLFNLLFYIPMYVFVAYKNMVSNFIVFLFLYQLLFFLFYTFLKFSFRPLLKRSRRNFFRVIGFVLVATLLINGYYNGFRIKIDLEDVYDNRLAVRDMAIPSILNYIKAASYFVGIVALMYGLKVRSITIVVSVIFLQLMSFAFGASKTQFFTIFICLIAYYFYSDKFKLWAPVSLVAILSLSVIEIQYLNSSLITDMWTRRSLFVPSFVSYSMFDFFESAGRDFLYLKGSVLRFVGFEDPYAAQNGFQRMIGLEYLGGEDTNANTGLLGDDYAQLGWGALIFYPFIRVFLLRLYDFCAKGIDSNIIVVVSIFVAFSFISGSLFSVLITKAILLLNYLLYCWPGKKINLK